MKLRHIIFVFIAIILISACNDGSETVTIKTPMGNMKVELYNSTPEHKKNFLKLVTENFYDSLLFHRVMRGFMVQGGDPNSRGASPEARLGTGGPGYTIPQEIGAPHFKGTLAAARQPDSVNPEKASSGSQFYLVHGKPLTAEELSQWEVRNKVKYNEAQKKKYLERGGTPMLDGDYTVFGEVIEGMEVIDKIAAVQVASGNRPTKDVWMSIEN